MVKIAQKRESSQNKMCGAIQYKPNRSKSTSRAFDRGCVFVAACPMLITHAHMQQSQQLQQRSSSQRVGALSLVPSCLGISGHPSGSRQGHPRYTMERSAEIPWVARTQFSTAVQCRNTANKIEKGKKKTKPKRRGTTEGVSQKEMKGGNDKGD